MGKMKEYLLNENVVFNKLKSIKKNIKNDKKTFRNILTKDLKKDMDTYESSEYITYVERCYEQIEGIVEQIESFMEEIK